MASRDQVRQRLLTRLNCVKEELLLLEDGVSNAGPKPLDTGAVITSHCADELLLAEAATEVRVDAAALLQAAQDVWSDAVLWEQAAWETYWNCESP